MMYMYYIMFLPPRPRFYGANQVHMIQRAFHSSHLIACNPINHTAMLIARTFLKHSRSPAAALRAFSAAAAPNAGRDSSFKPPNATLATLGAAALLGAAAAGTVTALEEDPSKYQARPAQKYPSPEPNPIHSAAEENHQSQYNHPPPRHDLPTIAFDDVAEHCDESSLWYTFRGGVYDLTFFYHGHPSGEPVSSK
jgi:hypothetical protein